MKFYIDGDEEYPTICGTGMEDYFGGSWSFAKQVDGKTVEQNYNTPFLGYPYYSTHDERAWSAYCLLYTSTLFEKEIRKLEGQYKLVLHPAKTSDEMKMTGNHNYSGEFIAWEREDDYEFYNDPTRCV